MSHIFRDRGERRKSVKIVLNFWQYQMYILVSVPVVSSTIQLF